MANKNGRVGILTAGGPAPGINSVIAAATIRSILNGCEVIGIHGGFKWLMQGKTSETSVLEIERVSRIHFRGGSELGTARANPTKNPEHMMNTLSALKKLGIDKLITIGGDDTAFSALTLEKESQGDLRVVHVPKTIDNDLALPHGINTFGYQTARHVGSGLAKNLMIDAKTTARWYLIISMGRKAGHLALGIGKAAGVPLTIIPEEFRAGNIPVSQIVDIIAGAIIKRLADGRADGVAVLAEGLIERLDPASFDGLKGVGYDEHGHVKLANVPFGPMIKSLLKARLAELNMDVKITDKDIGYELRCAEPIPYDMEYTRDLGFCAAEFITNGGTGAIVSIQDGRFKPLFFSSILDPETGRARVRMVDVTSEYYYIARRYMLRLQPSDFAKKDTLARFASIAGLSEDDFRKQFEYLMENDALVDFVKQKRSEHAKPEDIIGRA